MKLMREAQEKVAMRVTGYCLMKNHFHLLLWPHEDGDLSRWMQWLMTSHIRRIFVVIIGITKAAGMSGRGGSKHSLFNPMTII